MHDWLFFPTQILSCKSSKWRYAPGPRLTVFRVAWYSCQITYFMFKYFHTKLLSTITIVLQRARSIRTSVYLHHTWCRWEISCVDITWWRHAMETLSTLSETWARLTHFHSMDHSFVNCGRTKNKISPALHMSCLYKGNFRCFKKLGKLLLTTDPSTLNPLRHGWDR